MNHIKCHIVSAEAELFSDHVTRVIVSGSEGELGIYPGHAALLTLINPGPVRLHRLDGEESTYYVCGGFLEVQPHEVTILADSAVRAQDLDEKTLLNQQQALQNKIKKQGKDFNYNEALSRLTETAAQLRALKAMRSKYKR